MRSLLLLPLLLGLLASPAWAGELYKWTDEKGQVHYSDKPPARKEGVEVETREIPPQPEPPPAEVIAPESLECQMARKNLKTLSDSRKVRMDTNGDGVLDDVEGPALALQRERAAEQVKSFCEQK